MKASEAPRAPGVAADTLPLARPMLSGRELTYLREVLASGNLAGDGPFGRRCEAILEQKTGTRVRLVHSGTAALEMIALLSDVGPGDEVILPSFTFPSTASAFALRGARLVFVDVEPDTLNIGPDAVAAAVTDRTRAVVAVHYAGIPCDVDALRAVIPPGIWLVEDAAQAVGSSRRGQPAGTLGDAAAYSFHATKNVVAGEGGALLVNRPAWEARADILREKGTNRAAFLAGDVPKYSWCDLGSSYVMSELQAAVLCAQLERMEVVTARRLTAYDCYHASLESLELRNLVRRPRVPEDCRHNGHLYFVRVASRPIRDALVEALRTEGIGAATHFEPLHTSGAGLRHGRTHGTLETTERAAATLLRLPLFPEIERAEQARVVERLTAHLERLTALNDNGLFTEVAST